MKIITLFLLAFFTTSVWSQAVCKSAPDGIFKVLDSELIESMAANEIKVRSRSSGGEAKNCSDSNVSGDTLYKGDCLRAAAPKYCPQFCASKSRCFLKVSSNNGYYCHCGKEGTEVAEENATCTTTTNTNSEILSCDVEDPLICDAAEPEIAEELDATSDHTIQCGDVEFEQYAKDKKEREELQKNLKKQCRGKAKEYKKALLKQLTQDGKYGQALKVLFKRKKYSTKSTNTAKEDRKQTIAVDVDNFENMTNDELSQYAIAQLEEQYPGLQQQSLDLMNNDPKYRYGFHVQESVPVSISLNRDGKAPCHINLADFPTQEPFTPYECKSCNPKPDENYFASDCSYMVAKDGSFTEKNASDLMSIKTKNEYCNREDMSPANSGTDMTEINKTADEICAMTQQGLTPKFTIETSRNRHDDKTPELAQKRGAFIQSYIYDRLKKNCKLDVLPDWLEEEGGREKFNGLVQVKHPYYEGGAEGDYGPNPEALKADQPNEMANLKTTLAKEKSEIEEQIKIIDEKLIILDTETGNNNTTVTNNKKQYTDLTTKLDKEKDLKEIQSQYDDINEVVGNTMDTYENQKGVIQNRANLLAEKATLQSKLSDYTDEKMNGRIDKLNLFYKTLNELRETGKIGPTDDIPSALRKIIVDGKTVNLDEGLFDDFKMVRITGKAEVLTSSTPEHEHIPPKLQVMMDIITNVEQYACTVDPIKTNKTSFSGIGKGLLKIGTFLTIPAALVAAPFIGLGIGIKNKLDCIGCGKPGNRPPVFQRIKRALSKTNRRIAKEKIKGAFHDYVTWNGVLDVDKEKYGRTYSDFDTYAKTFYGDDYANKSRTPDPTLRPSAPVTKGKTVTVSYTDSNGQIRSSEKITSGGTYNNNTIKKLEKRKDVTVEVVKDGPKTKQVIVKDSSGAIIEIYDYEKKQKLEYIEYNDYGDKINRY